MPEEKIPVRWSAMVTYEKVPEPPTDDQIDILMDDNRTMMSHDGNLHMLAVQWYQEEEAGVSLAEFSAGAVAFADARLSRAGIPVGDAVHVEANDDNRPHRSSELYRYADFAFFGGVSRQAVAQAARTDPSFPRPLMKLSDGTPLFHPMRAVEYAQKRWPDADGEGDAQIPT